MQAKDLRAFIEVYNYGSINKAAQNLFMTPQGLSKILYKLEEDLDVCLFTRTQRGVTPTVYGDLLYERGTQIINLIDVLYKDIKQEGRERVHLLHVASTHGVIPYLTIDFINDFRTNYPNVELNISEGPDISVDDLLWAEHAEIGFLASPIDLLKYNATFFLQHYHCLVINKSHPLAEKERIDYRDLDGQPLALASRQFMPYHNNMNRFLRAGVKPKIILETNEIEGTHQVAAMNRGFGLTVDFQAFANPYPNTVIRPFTDENCLWETYIVTKKGRLLSKEAQIFQRFALDWLERHRHRLFEWHPYG